MRGGSYSGNIADAELARHAVLDIFASDDYQARLADCGQVRVGFRADLVQAKFHGEQPVIQQV